MPSLSYFDRHLGPVTLRECSVCCTKYRLVSFRRWDTNHPDKRTLHDVCNACASPPKDLTPAQLDFKERQITQRLSTAAIKRHQQSRRTAWSHAITHRLKKELIWAHKHATTPAPASSEWQKFFEVYVRTLRKINTKVLLRIRRPNAPITPTPEESNPMTYINPHTLTTLKELYSQCPVIPGRKLYRDPWCLEWREE